MNKNLFIFLLLFVPFLHATELHVQKEHLIPFMVPEQHKRICKGKMINGTKKKTQLYLNEHKKEPLMFCTFGVLLQQAGSSGKPLEIGLITEIENKKRYNYLFAADDLIQWLSQSISNPQTRKPVRSVLFFKYDPVNKRLDFKELKKYSPVRQQQIQQQTSSIESRSVSIRRPPGIPNVY
jgi:hypothetical protein